jgi:hypothetical protein
MPPFEEIGYEAKTTYWLDFSIADRFGVDAIQDTFDRSFNDIKSGLGTVYVTELSMVLNWKIWQYYKKNDKFVELYDRLWRKIDVYAIENLKGNDLTYYLQTID